MGWGVIPGKETEMTIIRTENWGNRSVRIGKCECGGEVDLANFTNT